MICVLHFSGEIVFHDSAMLARPVTFQGVDIAERSVARFQDASEQSLVIGIELERTDPHMGWQMRGVGGADDSSRNTGPVEDGPSRNAGDIGRVFRGNP